MNADLNWLTDPRVFQVNRLDAHSDHVCYASARELAEGESSLRQSLDGTWKFVWSPKPELRPAGFWREDFDASAFGTIQVPGHMELQGYGRIQYINTLYPWDGHAQLRPPEIDWEDCPVGSYVREFDLYEGLLGKQVCISFQGVEQAFYLWLNGQFIGYAEDSFTPSDFDLTPYLREKGNRLCVEVYKRSSAAWIEDQDFFRFSGIFRSVFLYAKPAVHLADLWLQAGLETDNATGTLSIRLLLEGEGTVHCRVAHPEQGTLFDSGLELTPEDKYLRSQPLRFEEVLPWGHGHPELYTVTLTLSGTDGEVYEVVPYHIGFRRFELKNGLMLLNGKRPLSRRAKPAGPAPVRPALRYASAGGGGGVAGTVRGDLPRPEKRRRLRLAPGDAPYPRLPGPPRVRLPCGHPCGGAAEWALPPDPGNAGPALCLLRPPLHPTAAGAGRPPGGAARPRPHGGDPLRGHAGYGRHRQLGQRRGRRGPDSRRRGSQSFIPNFTIEEERFAICTQEALLRTLPTSRAFLSRPINRAIWP